MTPATVNVNVGRGTTLGIQITCKDVSGNIVDLTGWTAKAQVRGVPGSALVVDLQPTVAAPATSGIVNINLAPAATLGLPAGKFKWDLFFTLPTGQVQGPYITGQFNVITPVTTLP